MAQPKSRLSLMMWLYAVLIIVMRMRSAAALSAARITSTPMESGFMADLDHQASVVLDRQGVGNVDDGRRARFLDDGRTVDAVSGAEIAALEDAKLDQLLRRRRIDHARRERRGPRRAAVEHRQPRALQRIRNGESQVDQLHLDVRRHVAIRTLVRGV